jgi:hypothetical protein
MLGPQFDRDPDFNDPDKSYLKVDEDGSKVAMSYVDTPEGRMHYSVHTGPGFFDVNVRHGEKHIGSLYGPGAAPGGSETELPIGEVSVHSKYGRRGLATQMLRLARQQMPEGFSIIHSAQLTNSGKKWVEGLKSKGIER